MHGLRRLFASILPYFVLKLYIVEIDCQTDAKIHYQRIDYVKNALLM